MIGYYSESRKKNLEGENRKGVGGGGEAEYLLEKRRRKGVGVASLGISFMI